MDTWCNDVIITSKQPHFDVIITLLLQLLCGVSVERVLKVTWVQQHFKQHIVSLDCHIRLSMMSISSNKSLSNGILYINQIISTLMWSKMEATSQMITSHFTLEALQDFLIFQWPFPMMSPVSKCVMESHQNSVKHECLTFQSAPCLLMAWCRQVLGHLQAQWWPYWCLPYILNLHL